MSGADTKLPHSLPLERLPRGTAFYRIHHSKNRALWFGPARGTPPTNRFDDPLGKYRVCYVGCSPEAAFAEKLLRAPPVRLVSRTALSALKLTTTVAAREIRVVSLRGAGLARLGITAAVAMGHSYSDSQALGRRIHDHDDRPDGILYRCRHDDDAFAVALFDRARQAVRVRSGSSVRLGEDLARLASMAARYGFGFTV